MRGSGFRTLAWGGLVLAALAGSNACNGTRDADTVDNDTATSGDVGDAKTQTPGDENLPYVEGGGGTGDRATGRGADTGDVYASGDRAAGTGTTTGRSTTGAGRTTWDAPAESTSQQPTRSGGTVVRTLPAGQSVNVVLLDDLSSSISRSGDSFRTRVSEDVVHDGAVVIPAGSVVRGSVVEATPLNPKIGGRAKLVLDFDRVELPSGETAPISASFEQIGKSESARDAATIAGATAGGALLGRILKDEDRKKGTLIGAVVGAATGTAIAARTEGQEVQIVSGTPMTIELKDSVQVPVRL